VLAGYAFTYSAGTLTITAAPNAVPAITSLTPPNLQTGSSAFTLAMTGTGFANGAIVSWNGSARATAYVDAGHLTANITMADLATVGTAAVTVFNPAPGGGTSSAFLFAIDTASAARGAFTVSAASATLNIAQGTSTVVPITFTGLNTGAQLTAACLNLPAGGSCSFDTASRAVTITSTSATPKSQYQITVVFGATQQLTSMLRSADTVWLGFVLLPISLLACRRRSVHLAALLFAACLALTLTGCGAGGTTAPASTPVSVATQTSLPFTVNIN
jgi:hypothetical protein